jgi:hypothetical protein
MTNVVSKIVYKLLTGKEVPYINPKIYVTGHGGFGIKSEDIFANKEESLKLIGELRNYAKKFQETESEQGKDRTGLEKRLG